MRLCVCVCAHARALFLWLTGYTAVTYYQYSENNVMHTLFNLLRIKGLYRFQALLTHPQEALHKLHPTETCGHARNIPRGVCVAPPEGEQIMFETRRGP
jgi:hypothetical protein